MKSNEKYDKVDSLKERVIAKTIAMLGEPREDDTIFWDGEGLLHEAAVAIRGPKYERYGSFVLDHYAGSVTAIERSVKRFGRLRTNYLAINGEPVSFSDGSRTRDWYYDLHGHQTYSAIEYTLLDQLLSSEGEERNEIYEHLSEIYTLNQKF